MSTITIRNVTVKDNGSLLNNATLSGSRDVLVDSASIEGNAVALENLIVGDFLQEVEDHVFEMSPDEYASFQELLQKGKGSKASFLTSLRQHLSNFAVGVAANVLSAYISKGLSIA